MGPTHHVLTNQLTSKGFSFIFLCLACIIYRISCIEHSGFLSFSVANEFQGIHVIFYGKYSICLIMGEQQWIDENLPLSSLSNRIRHLPHILSDRISLGTVSSRNHSRVFRKNLIVAHILGMQRILRDDFHKAPKNMKCIILR